MARYATHMTMHRHEKPNVKSEQYKRYKQYKRQAYNSIYLGLQLHHNHDNDLHRKSTETSKQNYRKFYLITNQTLPTEWKFKGGYTSLLSLWLTSCQNE